MQDIKQAKIYLDKAHKIRPTDSLCYKMYGDYYLAQKDLNTAFKYYEKGTTYNSNCYRCFEALGDLTSDTV